MKHFTKTVGTLAFVVLSSFNVNAQNANPFQTKKNILQEVNEINARSLSSYAAKPTAQDLRLTSSAQWSYSGGSFILLDSLNASWNGTNGARDFGYYNNFDIMTEWMAASDGSNFQYWYKVENEIDASGQVNASSLFQWNDVNSNWEKSGRFIYTYSNGVLVKRENQIWNNSSSSWDNYFLYTYTFNSNGLMTGSLGQKWEGGTWVNNSRTTGIEYNTNNQQTQSISQHYNSGSWVNSSKYLYSFNSSGDNEEEIWQSWVSGAWVNNFKKVRTFNL